MFKIHLGNEMKRNRHYQMAENRSCPEDWNGLLKLVGCVLKLHQLVS